MAACFENILFNLDKTKKEEAQGRKLIRFGASVFILSFAVGLILFI
jgi:hypothetical protein